MWKWLSIVLLVVVFLLVFGEGREEYGEQFREQGGRLAESLLRHAASRGSARRARALIYAGAGVDVPDSFGVTPLSLAAFGGHLDTARVLVNAGADVGRADRWGNTPLFWAAEGGEREMAVFLVDHGADPARANYYGWRPFEAALGRGHRQLAEMLRVEENDDREQMPLPYPGDESTR